MVVELRTAQTVVQLVCIAALIQLAAGVQKQVSSWAGLAGSTDLRDGPLNYARFQHDSWSSLLRLNPVTGDLYVMDCTALRVIHIASGTVVTIAGGAASGMDDGVGPVARFNALLSIEFDVTGTIAYVCDGRNHAIRQITLNNNSVTTLAGVKGIYGVDDGLSSTAMFYTPYGITRLGNGSLQVSDGNNGAIRIITQGQVWTVAGMKGVYGNKDGEYTNARFYFPAEMVTLDDGVTTLVADCWGAAIRKIVGRTVTTIVGALGANGWVDGFGTNARLETPRALCRVGDILFLTELNTNLIRRINITTKQVTTVAGKPFSTTRADGPVTRATFYSLKGMTAAPDFTLYVMGVGSGVIRRIACPAGYSGENCEHLCDGCAPVAEKGSSKSYLSIAIAVACVVLGIPFLWPLDFPQ